jgi:hypothetical protein
VSFSKSQLSRAHALLRALLSESGPQPVPLRQPEIPAQGQVSP